MPRFAISIGLILLSSLAAATALAAPSQGILARIDSLWLERRAIAADSLVEAALPRARAAADSALLLRLLLRQGQMHASLGRGPEAEAPLREVLLLARARDDSLHLCSGLRWLGVSLGNQGRHEAARGIYAAQLPLARAICNGELEAWALTGLAYCDFEAGRLEPARASYEEAVRLFRETSFPRGEIFALNGLGIALGSLADYAASRACYQRTVAVARELDAKHIEALAENNLGTLEYTLGDPGLALVHFRRAYAIHMAEDNLRQLITPATNVSLCEMALGRHDAAQENLEQLLRTCRDQGYADLEQMVMVELGASFLKQGRVRRAGRLFREVLAQGDKMAINRELEAAIGLLGALSEQDSSRAALAVLERYQAPLDSLGDPMIVLQFEIQRGRHFRRLGREEESLRILLLVDERAAALGFKGYRLEALIEAAHAADALAMPDSAAALWRRAAAVWQDERGLPLDPEWREIRGAAGARIYTELARHILAARDGAPLGQRQREAYDLLQGFKARTLLERMRGPAARATVDGETACTLAALQESVLRQGELLLDFYLGEGGSLLFAVSRGEFRVVALPSREELDGRLGLFRALLTRNPRDDGALSKQARREGMERGAAALYAILLDPVADLLAASEQLVFAPDGALNGLPLAALLELPRGAVSPQPAPAVQRIPSASFLASVRARPRADGARTLRSLALGGDRDSVSRSLPGTQRELNQLVSRYQGVERRQRAAGDTLTALLPAYDLLHFAAHSTANDQYPWRSSIHLAAADDAAEEWSLSAAQIADLRLRARLAVLASCESAGGRVLSGEGVQGLSAAFLSAGVPAVLASLWPVDDAATVLLMEHFYAALSQGQSAGTALRRAQSQLRLESRWEDPFFWSAFVLSGDGGVELPLLRRQNPLLLTILFGLSLICVFLWFFLSFFRRQRARFL